MKKSFLFIPVVVMFVCALSVSCGEKSPLESSVENGVGGDEGEDKEFDPIYPRATKTTLSPFEYTIIYPYEHETEEPEFYTDSQGLKFPVFTDKDFEYLFLRDSTRWFVKDLVDCSFGHNRWASYFGYSFAFPGNYEFLLENWYGDNKCVEKLNINVLDNNDFIAVNWGDQESYELYKDNIVGGYQFQSMKLKGDKLSGSYDEIYFRYHPEDVEYCLIRCFPGESRSESDREESKEFLYDFINGYYGENSITASLDSFTQEQMNDRYAGMFLNTEYVYAKNGFDTEVLWQTEKNNIALIKVIYDYHTDYYIVAEPRVR